MSLTTSVCLTSDELSSASAVEVEDGGELKTAAAEPGGRGG